MCCCFSNCLQPADETHVLSFSGALPAAGAAGKKDGSYSLRILIKVRKIGKFLCPLLARPPRVFGIYYLFIFWWLFSTCWGIMGVQQRVTLSYEARRVAVCESQNRKLSSYFFFYFPGCVLHLVGSVQGGFQGQHKSHCFTFFFFFQQDFKFR